MPRKKNEEHTNSEEAETPSPETSTETETETEAAGTASPEDSSQATGVLVKSEKEVLLELYKTLKDLGINSIGDLEVKISRL